VEALGFDPTVTRIRAKNEIQYKYQVGEECFITKETLSDHAADFIRGRGTRVFVAYSESDATEVVLKDVWLEDDKTEEGKLLEHMKLAISKMKAQGEIFPGGEDFLKYFLSVRAHGRVKTLGQSEDHTTNVMMRGCSLPTDRKYFQTSQPKVLPLRISRVIGSDRGYSKGHTPQISRDVAAMMYAHMPREDLRFQPRIHYRIVFNELGKTIHSLRSLSDVFRCLVDTTSGACHLLVIAITG
jgi:hypothetical protein